MSLILHLYDEPRLTVKDSPLPMAGIVMPGKIAEASLRWRRPSSSSRCIIVTCNEQSILAISHTSST